MQFIETPFAPSIFKRFVYLFLKLLMVGDQSTTLCRVRAGFLKPTNMCTRTCKDLLEMQFRPIFIWQLKTNQIHVDFKCM